MVNEISESAYLRWIPLLPFLAAAFHGVMLALVRRPISRAAVVGISLSAVLGSLVLTCAAFAELVGLTRERPILIDTVYAWVGVGVGHEIFSADLAFQVDALSAVMCLVVTGVGLLIHVYSVGYMDDDQREDRGFQRFFCYLNLFLASMLVLVLADNLLLMFMGWEGVGLCSYLLIGFWYSDRDNAYCGSKAFIINRVGDFGFLVGFLLLFWSLVDVGSAAVSFRAIEAAFPKIADATVALPVWLGGSELGLPTLIGLCFFLGACGKSAQLPLYVWLPDAMAGPTPVSALIHAATMVTAGVYLVCRLSFLYAAAPGASLVIAWVGALTALVAASIALAQTDIKKVLAYSTVSQLGFMFLAAGCGAYSIAMFHLVTHAFFKALLFMGAGAVILAMHHEQDMTKMGGLRKRLPNTHIVMAIGVAAIAGLPPLSGFFSKDEVLLSAYLAHDVPGHMALYGIGLFTAVLTAFYMTRLLCLTFYVKTQVDPNLLSRMVEPVGWVMWPLYFLAALSFVGGLVDLPQFWGDLLPMEIENSDSLGHFLSTVVVPTPHQDIGLGRAWALIGVAVLAAASGIAGAFWLYLSRPERPERWAARLSAVQRLLRNNYYVDELYDAVIVRPLVAVSDRVLFRGVDVGLVDGVAVNGTARGVRFLAAHGLKYLHAGLAQSYLLLMVVGVLAIVMYLVR